MVEINVGADSIVCCHVLNKVSLQQIALMVGLTVGFVQYAVCT